MEEAKEGRRGGRRASPWLGGGRLGRYDTTFVWGRFGPIDSIRRLPRKFCAFINYTCREAAEAAYAALQGAEVEGCKLVLQLKHPAHATAPPSKAAPGNCLSSWA